MKRQENRGAAPGAGPSGCYDARMRGLLAIWVGARFAAGASLGVGLGVVFFLIALVRRARPVHAEGLVCRARLVPRDGALGPRLAGPALARFSGAFTDERGQRSDVLGLILRLRTEEHERTSKVDGDQDLLLGTFESFRTAARDRAATDVSDYLANTYSSVTPWWLPGWGPATLRLARVTSVSVVTANLEAATAASRREQLERALASGRGTLLLVAELGGERRELAEVHLLERLDEPGHALRGSMLRCGRGVRPVGFRNGLRTTLYPMSQFGRRLRGR